MRYPTGRTWFSHSSVGISYILVKVPSDLSGRRRSLLHCIRKIQQYLSGAINLLLISSPAVEYRLLKTIVVQTVQFLHLSAEKQCKPITYKTILSAFNALSVSSDSTLYTCAQMVMVLENV